MEKQKRLSHREIPGWCALCRSRCGQIALVEQGELVGVRPDPSHPTGGALCVKGRAAPEFVSNPQRLLYPMRRTRPKTDPDPGWQRIGWDEALDSVAQALVDIAAKHGPEAVTFAVTSPSSSPISDGISFILRFINRLGSPNIIYATEICNWHKDFGHAFTFGRGISTPDFANAGCVLLWGHNPSASWLYHATAVAAARKRGAKIVVVDPRRAGAAATADQWLRVRPGTDGALALGIANIMLTRSWYDGDFLRDWSNGPLLVRADTGRFLHARDAGLEAADGEALVAWNKAGDAPALFDPVKGLYDCPSEQIALSGARRVGGIDCSTAFDRYAALCAEYTPERVADICWIDAAQVEATAELLGGNGPVCMYGWAGIGQHTNATQTDRAIGLLYALTGSFDAPGGNMAFTKLPTPDISGAELMTETQRAKALGLGDRPLGPARQGLIHSRDFYRAALQGDPYPVLGLFSFGANVAVSHADPLSARRALAALAFHVHADVVLNPTAQFADIVLPVCTQWEREALRIGFEVNQEAEELIQLRQAAIPPRGESRSDAWIVFELAKRLGFAADFWDGDMDAAYRHTLAPTGVSLETLRANPQGVRLPLVPVYRKYSRISGDRPEGLATPTRKVEVYSEQLLDHGYDPLPGYVEPAVGPALGSDVGPGAFPLVLTTAHPPHYIHGSHREIPALRRRGPDPLIALHPDTAAARGIADGDWVEVRTPKGRIRLRARFDGALDPRVVVGQYGWWQANERLGMPGYDPFSATGSNYNLLIGNDALDPISGSVPHRSYVCEVSPPTPGEGR